jgi:ComF family protein
MQLFELLFPAYCFNCEKEWAHLCVHCKKQLVPHAEKCPVCHRYSPERYVCLNCRKSYQDIAWVIIAFQYTWVLKKLIRKLKYWHVQDLANFLAQRLQFSILTHRTLLQAKDNNKLIISYVPSHWRKKHMVKGYNQSQLLAESLADIIHVPCVQLWKKIRHTKSQAKLSREKRMRNLYNAFMLTKHTLVWDEYILIIDDISTTGSTIHELAKIYKKKYPKSTIRWCVLWRHGK